MTLPKSSDRRSSTDDALLARVASAKLSPVSPHVTRDASDHPQGMTKALSVKAGERGARRRPKAEG
jgi:hypothetical protein